MNKLVPFSKFSQATPFSGASVIVDQKNIPLGFVFGRDAFISLCTVIDDEFEKRVKNPKKAFNNPAGKLIDLIEEKLPVNPNFAKALKSSIAGARKTRWIPMEEITRSINA